MSLQTVLLFVCVILVHVCVGQRSNGAKTDCEKNGQVEAHDDFCDSYYECVEGRFVERLCPNGLAFLGTGEAFSGRGRGLLKNCDYVHKVGCPDEKTERQMGQSPQGSGHCPWLFGIFPHENSCNKYWHCWNGTGALQKCPTSLLYNEVKHACDWPDNVPECQQNPLCNENTNGVKPIADSCNRYWRCAGGYPRMERCPAGTAFSEEQGRCALAQEVPGCEPYSPPPEEKGEVITPKPRRQKSRTSRTTLNDGPSSPPPEENEEVQTPPPRRQQFRTSRTTFNSEPSSPPPEENEEVQTPPPRRQQSRTSRTTFNSESPSPPPEENEEVQTPPPRRQQSRTFRTSRTTDARAEAST